MDERIQFQQKIKAILDQIGGTVLSYNEDEFWMIRAPYEYIEFYAVQNQLANTAIALALARGLHDGVHRKASIINDGISYRLPYMIHPLIVCRMLLDLHIPLPREEEDILLASALCHDMIEDIPFEHHGQELVTEYHLDNRVLETVRKVSKRKDFTEKEEQEHFRQIREDPLASLVKLSDRGNNVEDLYNMSVWKVHEYVDETERLILPICDYGMVHYPELHRTFEILQDKLICLTSAAVILIDRYDRREKELQQELLALRGENARLREQWKKLWSI